MPTCRDLVPVLLAFLALPAIGHGTAWVHRHRHRNRLTRFLETLRAYAANEEPDLREGNHA